MLDRSEVSWSRILVPVSDAACEFIPKLGEQRIKLGGALTADGQEVRGGHWTEDESQDLRMVNIFFVYSSILESDHNSMLTYYIND